jgi:hypothetical protein
MEKPSLRRTRRGGIKCKNNTGVDVYNTWPWQKECKDGYSKDDTQEDCSKLSFYQKWGKNCRSETSSQPFVSETDLPECSMSNGYGYIKKCKRSKPVIETDLPECSMSNGYGYLKKCKPSAPNPVKTEQADLRGVSYDRDDERTDTFRDLGNTQDRTSYDRDDERTDTFRDLGNTQDLSNPIRRGPYDAYHVGGKRKKSKRNRSRKQKTRRR